MDHLNPILERTGLVLPALVLTVLVLALMYPDRVVFSRCVQPTTR